MPATVPSSPETEEPMMDPDGLGTAWRVSGTAGEVTWGSSPQRVGAFPLQWVAGYERAHEKARPSGRSPVVQGVKWEDQGTTRYWPSWVRIGWVSGRSPVA